MIINFLKILLWEGAILGDYFYEIGRFVSQKGWSHWAQRAADSLWTL
jgi:hypothetical protein